MKIGVFKTFLYFGANFRITALKNAHWNLTEDPLYQDQALILQSIQGDVQAFGRLYELHRDKVFAFAFVLTKSKDIAEETVQEVFLKLWEKRRQITPGHSFPAYLRTITYHQVLSFFRKVKRDQSLQQQLYHHMQELARSGADALIDKELSRLYHEAVECLPPQKKEIYRLSREANMSYDEIAEKMGLSKNTVRNHMTAAIQLVRRYVKEHRDTGYLVIAICSQHFFSFH